MARLKIRVQLYCGEEIAMGPGKAALLAAIRDCGSISGAARSLGLSYRRAWLLVDTMNRCFAERLVATRPGGGSRPGAVLTAAGEAALARYGALVERLERAAGEDAQDGLADLLRSEPLPAGALIRVRSSPCTALSASSALRRPKAFRPA